jgi:hypothetical protein
MELKLFKRKEVPEELPDLATDTLGKINSKGIEKDQEIISSYLKEKEDKNTWPKNEKSQTIENGFFNKVQGDINKEIADINKLESWYNNKFLPQDNVSNMKKYWEKHKKDSIMNAVGGKFKEQIREKAANLQKIEKEWQDTYFQLIEKEEEMRKEEQELKKILAEFVDMHKESKGKKHNNG